MPKSLVLHNYSTWEQSFLSTFWEQVLCRDQKCFCHGTTEREATFISFSQPFKTCSETSQNSPVSLTLSVVLTWDTERENFHCRVFLTTLSIL